MGQEGPNEIDIEIVDLTKYKDPNESTLPNLLYDPVNIVCIEEY